MRAGFQPCPQFRPLQRCPPLSGRAALLLLLFPGRSWIRRLLVKQKHGEGLFILTKFLGGKRDSSVVGPIAGTHRRGKFSSPYRANGRPMEFLNAVDTINISY